MLTINKYNMTTDFSRYDSLLEVKQIHKTGI